MPSLRRISAWWSPSSTILPLSKTSRDREFCDSYSDWLALLRHDGHRPEADIRSSFDFGADKKQSVQRSNVR
jgi:hypothetical protein